MNGKAYEVYELVFGANERKELPYYGRTARVLYNSSLTDLSIQIGDDFGLQRLPQGVGFRMPGDQFFNKIALTNNAGTSVTVYFAVSSGEIDDSRFTLTGSISVNSTPDTLETPAAISVPDTVPGTPQIAASASRREIIAQNNGGFDLWFGDEDVDGSVKRGTKIPPDGTFLITSGAAVYFRAVGGTTTLSLNYGSKS